MKLTIAEAIEQEHKSGHWPWPRPKTLNGELLEWTWLRRGFDDEELVDLELGPGVVLFLYAPWPWAWPEPKGYDESV